MSLNIYIGPRMIVLSRERDDINETCANILPRKK